MYDGAGGACPCTIYGVRRTIAMLTSFIHWKRMGGELNEPGENFIGTRVPHYRISAIMCSATC